MQTNVPRMGKINIDPTLIFAEANNTVAGSQLEDVDRRQSVFENLLEGIAMTSVIQTCDVLQFAVHFTGDQFRVTRFKTCQKTYHLLYG